MQKLGSGVITTTQDVDCVEFDWGKIHFLSEPAVTNADRFSFGIVELSQGKGHTRHNHPGSEEIIYVVSGEGEQMVDDKPPVKVGPGASIYIPADVYHSTVNTGTETMKLIVVYSPAGPERLLREIPGAEVIPATRKTRRAEEIATSVDLHRPGYSKRDVAGADHLVEETSPAPVDPGKCL
jgi:oxalate decarboxylase/phosphoglucose isomerase-like protein (cupin superfamily)